MLASPLLGATSCKLCVCVCVLDGILIFFIFGKSSYTDLCLVCILFFVFIRYLTGGVDKRTLEKYEREAKEKNRESWFVVIRFFIMPAVICQSFSDCLLHT